jgi:hypothetical protein
MDLVELVGDQQRQLGLSSDRTLASASATFCLTTEQRQVDARPHHGLDKRAV